ncbi:MAG: DUF1015 domain-containing protein [Culicoidibacterales bacterium]
MVTIVPFKSIRPTVDKVAKIASLPYDVLSSAEARVLGDENKYSFLHIDKAEIDLPVELSPYDDLVYEQASQAMADFMSRGWLQQDEANLLYIYELTMNGRSQVGLVVCTSIDDYLNELIKKHEFTREEKELDRIAHVDSCDANTSPIFLTYRGVEAINAVISGWINEHDPMYDFKSFHDVKHRVWSIDDRNIIDMLVGAFNKDVQALYIADGHHRTESAVKVGLQRRQEFPNAKADAAFNYFLSVVFPQEQLAILDYNRVVNVPIAPDFMEQLACNFSVDLVGASIFKPTKPTEIGMYLANNWYKLTVKETAIVDDSVGGLDVSLLQKYVLEDLFGIMDIRTDKRIDFVGGIRGLEELVTLVDSGAFTVAFAMYATTVEQLLQVADEGKIMPPKSTWFEPKLLSGLFVHDLETK